MPLPMLISTTFCAAIQLLVAVAYTQETVYASFVLTRTGERTPLVEQTDDFLQLTALGANGIYSVGDELRTRYIKSSTSPSTSIIDLSPDLIDPVQLSILSRDNQYCIASAQAFMQAFYPPTTKNDTVDTIDLGLVANGSVSVNPLNGYQYAWIHAASSADPESLYTDGTAQCSQWTNNAYSWLGSDEFKALQNASADLYARAGDILGDDALPSSLYDFENAYVISDYLSYMYRHNSTVHDLLTNGSYLNPEHFGELIGLSNQYQWALYGSGYSAGNATITPIAGQALASLISSALYQHVQTLGQSNKLSLLFTEAPAFLSFSALAQLPDTPASDGIDFTAMPDFGSHLLLELFTNADPVTAGTYPDQSDLRVRLLFRNGTDTSTPLTTYPMFGTAQSSLTWADFSERLDNISLQGATPTSPTSSSLEAWCSNCNAWEDTFFCLYVNDAAQSAASGSNKPSTSSSQGSGMSNAVAGAIGAVATLCFFGLVMFLGVGCLGWRVTRKPYGNQGPSEVVNSSPQTQRTSGGGFKGAMKLASDTDLPTGAGSEPKHGRVSSWEMKNGTGNMKSESSTVADRDTWGRRREEDEMSERVDPFMDPVQPRESV